jgi:hypothetical protein
MWLLHYGYVQCGCCVHRGCCVQCGCCVQAADASAARHEHLVAQNQTLERDYERFRRRKNLQERVVVSGLSKIRRCKRAYRPTAMLKWLMCCWLTAVVCAAGKVASLQLACM